MELAFFGLVLPVVFAGLGYGLFKDGEDIANFTSPLDTDRSRGYYLLGVWACGVFFIVLAVLLVIRVAYDVLLE
ncbi:MAG: hypothetical protein KKA32_15055 [Actinobacteria bacterium]|nr:hypothetical protein [Actinomycetota bacterium]